MKFIGDNDLNFFAPKIKDKEDIIKKYMSISIKIYIVVFIATITYYISNMIIKNMEYDNMKKEVSNMQGVSGINNSLKGSLNYQSTLIDMLNKFTINQGELSDSIDKVNNIKKDRTSIDKFIWTENKMEIVCSAMSEDDAIRFINSIRKEADFRDVVYTGGKFSKEQNKFLFKLNIVL